MMPTPRRGASPPGSACATMELGSAAQPYVDDGIEVLADRERHPGKARRAAARQLAELRKVDRLKRLHGVHQLGALRHGQPNRASYLVDADRGLAGRGGC